MATARSVGSRVIALIAQNRGGRLKVPLDSRRYRVPIPQSAFRNPHFRSGTVAADTGTSQLAMALTIVCGICG
ncbi:MAG TPA: hypothetical protein VHS80_08510 [Chthoniobacterales bacterium]|nr:hypothetical protein [Chthoniobacterales bacterium]